MKLQTMLLPTGEFVFVVSKAKSPLGNIWLEFKDAIGATGCLVTDQEVEVENAIIDENARRVAAPAAEDVEGSETSDKSWEVHQHFPRVEFDLPHTLINQDGTISLSGQATSTGWVDIGAIRKETLEALFGGQVDETSDGKIYAALEAGADFTPAGLVDTREHPELRTTAELEPELAAALADRATPTFQTNSVGETTQIVDESGIQIFHGGEKVINIGDSENPVAKASEIVPWDGISYARVNDQTVAAVPTTAKLQIGDRVRITEVCGGNRDPYLDYVGVEGKVGAIVPLVSTLGENYWVRPGELAGIWASGVEAVPPHG